MSLLPILAGIGVCLPLAIPLSFFLAALTDYLAAGGRSATTTGSNDDGTLGLRGVRRPSAPQQKHHDPLRFLEIDRQADRPVART